VAEYSTVQGGDAGPTTGTERILAEVLADLVGVERVPVDSNFFDDLGADSLTMAHFCARVRKRADLPSVSMKDIYQHPTIRGLTAALADAAPPPVESSVPAPIEVVTPASTLEYVLCGTLQFLIFLGTSYLAVFVTIQGYTWIAANTGLVDAYLRSLLFGSGGFLVLCTLPILAKWVLIGRWKPQQIRIWSLAYVRFWLVKTLVMRNPLILLAVGSPLYPLYLRALGAKVGRGVTILTPTMPVCTDLLTIGDGTVIHKNSYLSCYRAHAGQIETGRVTIGKDVFVGEGTVMDIETSLGDGAQLGHTSSLHSGQAVPDGERWHGSPAQRTEVDYRTVDPTKCGTPRRALYGILQLVNLLFLALPLAILILELPITWLLQLDAFSGAAALAGSGPQAFTNWVFYRDVLAASLVLFFGPVLIGLLLLLTVPRVLNLAIKPNTFYPLYGLHYSFQRTIARLTNIKFYAFLFGDSSYIVRYLRCLGYSLTPVKQTGSNFGQRVKHDNPYLASVGRGTVVADGLSMINAEYSSTSFRISPVSIGRDNFIGNNINYPSQGRTGDNCLLGTKAMVPIDGKVREGVGLLGSPSFEIPRTVLRDSGFVLWSRRDLRRRLSAKNRHNVVTMGLYLLVRWGLSFVVTLVGSGAAYLYNASGALVIAVSNVVILLFSIGYWVLVERAVTFLMALKPLGCSIYDRDFWRHERFWKIPAQTYLLLFNGTPFKNVIWRLLGVRIGRRVFDDGCGLVERPFVSIGDYCTLNAGSIIQTHSQEDGAFKSDYSTIGAGCTLGVGAFVHYGVTIGDGAVLAPDSFLMKGEEMPPHARWGGNPAREMGDQSSAKTATASAATAATWSGEGKTLASVSGGTTRWER
jgi:non-ribosomal peptide synthetase-like protein